MITLYDECKLALQGNLVELNKHETDHVMKFFITHYPVTGYTSWNNIPFIEYDNRDELLSDFRNYHPDLMQLHANQRVWVLADNRDIPKFQSEIKAVLEHFHDVDALSTRVIIFNEDYIIEQIFPYSNIRIGFK